MSSILFMKIIVIGIGCNPPEFLNKLSETFSAKISFDKIRLPKDSYNPEKDQFSAEKILNILREKEFKKFKPDKILGVTEIDIDVRELNFVFGLSEIGGRNCLISLHRLHPEFYGETNEKLFDERTLKEGIHELGHSFGLDHCENKKCVMHFSNSIEEVDKKSSRFCEKCTKILSELELK